MIGITILSWRSRSQQHYEKAILKNLVKFIKNYLQWRPCLVTLQACNFTKKGRYRRCFPVNFEKKIKLAFL